MKFMNMFLVGTLLTGFAFGSESTPLEMSTAVTSLPTMIVYSSASCYVNPPENDLGIASCYMSQILGAGLITTSVLVLLKEEIKQVEPDAYNFLAGEQMTLALQEVIEKLRSESEEVENLSDTEIAMIMVQSL